MASPHEITSIPPGPGIIRFTTDQSYMTQSETTISVDPANPRHVVGGVNDSRYFLCPSLPVTDCPSSWTQSLSGFGVSTDGGSTVAFSDDIPSLSVGVGTNAELLVSWGDPGVAATTGGNFYYSSLVISPNGSFSGNGVELAVSNSNLWSNPATCKTPEANPTTNPCWKAALVFGSTGSSVSTLEDKPMIAVDRDPKSKTYGDAYIGWDHFNSDGTSSSYLARCDRSLRCTMLSGGPKPVLSGTDPFAAFTTPVVGPDGTVHVTWCNYGTVNALIPITCRQAAMAPGAAAFGSTSTVLNIDGTTYNGLEGYATEQFRTASIPVLAVDDSSTATAHHLYFAIDACTSGNYYDFSGPNTPGNCGASAVLFSSSTDGGSSWSGPIDLSANAPTPSPGTAPADAVTAQPWVTVDPSTGELDVAYYTTQFDRFDHRLDVELAASKNGGSSWSFSRLTPVSIEPDSDPNYYNTSGGFGGSQVTPQFGDYFQAVANSGKLLTSFSATYSAALGTFRTNPYLAVTAEP
jgi:hypothetical protein